MPRGGKLLTFINWRIRVTISDSRDLIGTFLAFDKHMNLVLSDCEEFRKISVKGKKGNNIINYFIYIYLEEREEKRVLGLVILRGESIVRLNAETPPPPKVFFHFFYIIIFQPKVASIDTGAGIGRAAGRGIPAAPLGGMPQGILFFFYLISFF